MTEPRVIRLSQPAAEAITLADAKLHLRVTHNAENAYIETLVGAARGRAEDYCNRPFVEATFAVLYDGALPVGTGTLAVPVADVSAVDDITYRDSAGAVQTWDAADWSFDAERRQIRPADAWPAGTDLRIAVTAGNGDSPVTLPKQVRAAMLAILGTMYAHREDVVTGTIASAMPNSALTWLDPFRERLGL